MGFNSAFKGLMMYKVNITVLRSMQNAQCKARTM